MCRDCVKIFKTYGSFVEFNLTGVYTLYTVKLNKRKGAKVFT